MDFFIDAQEKASMRWNKYQIDKLAKKKYQTGRRNLELLLQCSTRDVIKREILIKRMKANNTGRGATEMVRNLNPCISSGPKRKTADGGGCSVWLPGSIW